MIASIPSPPAAGLHIGPFQLRAYGLMIALGVVAAVWLTRQRWVARGGSRDAVGSLVVWAVPAGVIGARAYHVITDWKSFRGDWSRAIMIWKGGLGIWGGIALGVTVGVVVARRRGMAVGSLLDAVAPALALAQAIGRLGNWWNQELFGRPASLPWAVVIDAAHRPAGYEAFRTFHPTFLYESLGNLALVAVLLLVDRRWGARLRAGSIFVLYVCGYTLMRFFIERLRIDQASLIAGLRVNEWVSATVFVAAAAVGVFRQRAADVVHAGESLAPGPPGLPVRRPTMHEPADVSTKISHGDRPEG